MLAMRMEMKEVEHLPLVTSQGVIQALQDGAVDYGVVAVRNSVAGTVGETKDALQDMPFTVLDEIEMPIHHCLFKKNAAVADAQINQIASHIQALQQCKNALKNYFPNAAWNELIDTAIAAVYLENGTLPETTAIVCRKDAGQAAGLYLIHENIEDSDQNRTVFQLISLSSID